VFYFVGFFLLGLFIRFLCGCWFFWLWLLFLLGIIFCGYSFGVLVSCVVIVFFFLTSPREIEIWELSSQFPSQKNRKNH